MPFYEAHSTSAWNRPPEYYISYNPVLKCNIIYFLCEESNRVNSCVFWGGGVFWFKNFSWFCHDFQVPFDLHESSPHCSCKLKESPPEDLYLGLCRQNVPCKYRAITMPWFLLFSLQVSDCLGVFDLSCPDNFQGIWNCFRRLAPLAGK